MAPSSKSSTLMALLVAFVVVVAPSLQPAADTRDGGVAKKAAAAPAPSVLGEEVLHPTWSYDIPDIPFIPRVIPCPPVFPKIPFIPCYNVTPLPPPVKECRSSLAKLVPLCASFLTNSSVPLPPASSCDGLRHYLSDPSTSPYCLCHVVNGDADQLLPAPVNRKRESSIMETCLNIPTDTISDICTDNGDMPPMDLPTPPPSPGGNTA